MDAFERRRMLPATSFFHGAVSIDSTEADAQAYQNYCNLLIGGYITRVFVDGKERFDCVSADPNSGVASVLPNIRNGSRATIRGRVEIRIERNPHIRPLRRRP